MNQVFHYKEGSGRIVQSMFEKIEQRPVVNTRAASGHSKYRVPAARGEIMRNSFAVRTVKHWNELPEDIKMSRTSDQFKRKLKIWRENGRRPVR
jgi:hypothetical protein